MDSELRQDLVSGDWIVVAPKRGLRPHRLQQKKKRIKAPKSGCPFEDFGNDPESFLLSYTAVSGKNAKKKVKADPDVFVVKNKFPAFFHKDTCAELSKKGPYAVMEARGYQELVVTKSHDKNFSALDTETAFLVFRAFADRYRTLSSDKCLSYISIFQNWGESVGASVYHPHYQIIGIPVIPPDISHSLRGSGEYFKKHKKCIHCFMLETEKNHKKRIIAENRGAIAFAPFASRQSFEVRIFPKHHSPYFEKANEKDMRDVASILQNVLRKLKIKLKDPDYNFFIHTAPVQNKKAYGHYHWHIEILPKISIWAGFELGTGIDITVVDPDEAASLLAH